MSETALVRTAEEDLRLLEKQRMETERKSLRKSERMAELAALVADVKLDSARIVDLRKYMFMEEAELDAIRPKLTKQQRAIIRQFEEPKKATAFGVESAARLIESETRAQAEKVTVRLNVENAVIQLPEKADESTPPVYIDVSAETK
jgi:multidrug resistance efflux pump